MPFWPFLRQVVDSDLLLCTELDLEHAVGNNFLQIPTTFYFT